VFESVIVNEWKAETRGQDVMLILEEKFGPVPPEVTATVQGRLTSPS